MTIIVGRHGHVGDIAGRIARLETLAHDLRRIAVGSGPTERELEGAPLIGSYRVRSMSIPCLVAGDGTEVLGPLAGTRHVWILAPDLGWARTLEGWRRLGTECRRVVQ
jgi:hypothetical protein